MESKRWLALDLFKAIAVFGMIVWHLSIWWINLNPTAEKGLLMLGITQWPYFLQAIVGLSANFSMSIPIIAGASLRFYLNNFGGYIERKKALVSIIKRAVLLAALGFVMNFLAFGSGYWYLWNVLQLISLSIIIITLFSLFSSLYLLAMSGFAVIFAAPFVRSILHDVNSYPALALVGDRLGDNIWSFFPWYGIIVYGFLITHLHFNFKEKKKKKLLKLSLLAGSFLIIVISIIKNKFFYAVDFRNPWGPLLFQPPTMTVLAQLSVFTILLVLFDLIFSGIRISKFGFINVFSKGILWIYFVHMIVGFRLIEFLADNGLQSWVMLLFVIAFIFLLSYAVGAVSIFKREKSS